MYQNISKNWLQKNLKLIIKYFSSSTNLQNGRQQIFYLVEIADFSHGIEFIIKAVIGQYNLRTIFLHSLEKIMFGYTKREKKIPQWILGLSSWD